MSKSSRSRASDKSASSPTSPSTPEDGVDAVDDASSDSTETTKAAAAKAKSTSAKPSATAKGKETPAKGKDSETKAKGTKKSAAELDEDEESTAKPTGKSTSTAKGKDSSAKSKDAATKSKDASAKDKDTSAKNEGTSTKGKDKGKPATTTQSRSSQGNSRSRSQRGRGSKKAAAQVSRREQLRRQREAAERARKRRMRIVTAAGALVLAGVLFVVGFVLYRDWDDKRKEAEALRAVQVIPPNANDAHTALSVGVKATDPNAPTLTVYQDFQCPACKSAEDRYGDVIRALAKSGKVNVEFRTLTFLDANLKNDSSVRSARAAACAATVGKYEEYHDTIYANQPETEGVGYTDEQLLTTFPEQAGITSNLLTTFQDCYQRKRTFTIVNEIAANALDNDKVSSTPTYKVNGKNPKWDFTNPESGETKETAWWQTLDATEDAWLAGITKVAQESDNNTPTPSK